MATGHALYANGIEAYSADQTETGAMSLARREFFDLSEAEVWAEVAQDDGPVAAEVTRLVVFYTKQLLAQGDRGDAGPRGMLCACVSCPIERVALLIIIGASGSTSDTVH